MSKLQPTQIDYPRNSGVLRWRRSLLPVQKSRMCSLQKSNKQVHFQVYDLPRRSHKIIRIDLGMDPLNACLWKREHYVIFRSDRVCHYVSCLPVTPTTRLEYTLFARIHSSGRWAKMGKVLLVSEATHRSPEQKEVNVLKRTSNKNMREAQRIPVLLCHEKCYHGPDTQNYTAEKVSSDGKSAIGFRETSGESKRRTYYKKKLKEYVRTNIVVSPKKPSDRRYDAQLIPMLSCGEKCYYAC